MASWLREKFNSEFWQGFRAEWYVLPNLITLFRLSFCWLPTYYLYYHNYEYAIFSFVILAITDFIDGKIARKWKMETKTGAILDPVVDKVAVILNLGALCFVNIRIIVPTIGITIREVYVALILASARKQKVTVATVYGGKVKMWAQCIAVILQYIALMLMGFWQKIAVDALWFAFGMTVSTGIEYFKKNRQRQ